MNRPFNEITYPIKVLSIFNLDLEIEISMPLLGFQHDYVQLVVVSEKKRSAVEFVFVLLTENTR